MLLTSVDLTTLFMDHESAAETLINTTVLRKNTSQRTLDAGGFFVDGE